jgi:hypothetical protein
MHTLLIGREAYGRSGTLMPHTRAMHWLVCKNHLYITRDRFHRFFVYDVSRRGTYVNDVRIPYRTPRELADGDTVTLGTGRFVLHHGNFMANPHTVVFTRLVPPRTALARGRRRPNSSQGERESVLRAVSCSVCTEPMCNAHTMSCGHAFCQSCACTWLASQPSCPTCRAPNTLDDLRPVVGYDDIAHEVVNALGSREDIAALSVRRQHQSLPGDHTTPITLRRAGPAMLIPEAADSETVLMRARVNGATQYFFAFRRALDSV